MIILLAAQIGLSNAAPAPRVENRAKASAIVVRGREISSKNWNPASQPAQREIIREEKDGRQILIRLTEFE